MDPMLDFRNQVVLITGAAQGLGKLLAESLAARGAKLVLSDINEKAVKQLANDLSEGGTEVVAMCCNVASNAECESSVNQAISQFGRLDIAVNNAGIAHEFMPLHCIDESILDSQFAVNVKGVQFGMRHQITQMLTQGGGRILNVSSMAGIGAAPTGSAYAMAKHAVIGLTKTGAVEYARHNILINAICPFFTLTPMVTSFADQAKQEKMSKGTPIQRLAAPEEIVAVMLMLLSPSNTYMTGQCIAVDGGVSAL